MSQFVQDEHILSLKSHLLGRRFIWSPTLLTVLQTLVIIPILENSIRESMEAFQNCYPREVGREWKPNATVPSFKQTRNLLLLIGQ